jgi:hypothetical protein
VNAALKGLSQAGRFGLSSLLQMVFII